MTVTMAQRKQRVAPASLQSPCASTAGRVPESSQVQDVRRIFDGMADEYDNLSDLWYRYTFARIDEILLEHFRPMNAADSRPLALDVGCGTGIQSLRLSELGYRVLGVDVAGHLLEIARSKHNAAGYHDATFLLADAQALPLQSEIAECVNCCGPTLSLIPDWRRALREMARCLKPGGRLLLEVEGKWNLDLLWEVVNAIGFNFLEYDEPLSKALSHLLPPWNAGYCIDYSFKLESGESVMMPIKLFTAAELRKELAAAGFRVQERWGLHVLTNLIPSTVLHRAHPRRALEVFFAALSRLERGVNGYWPFNALGCSLLVLARRHDLETRAH